MHLHQAEGKVCNNEKVRDAAAGAGFLNGTSDVDGVVRRLPLLIKYENEIYPSFLLAVLMHYQDRDVIRIGRENAQSTVLYSTI